MHPLPLPLPAAEFVRIAGREVGGQSDEFEQFDDPSPAGPLTLREPVHPDRLRDRHADTGAGLRCRCLLPG